MPQHSAGLLMYRRRASIIEVLLVHPGGPYWAKKDDGAWGIPKGLTDPGEDGLAAARREFLEETGVAAEGAAVALGDFRQPSRKIISAWGLEGDLDPSALRSNTFEMEWPPRSGQTQAFPEIDRAGWFAPEAAARKMLPGQRPILAALLAHLGLPPAG
ncbi:MAG: NUDIX domain-containing protein [Hyphomicrobiaceae bacterium]